MVSGHPAVNNQLDAVWRLDDLEQSHGGGEVVRQLLGLLHQSHALAGVEFLHEVVEVFGVLLEQDGVQSHPGDRGVLPAKLLGVGQHQEGVLSPVCLGSVDLLEDIRRGAGNNSSTLFSLGLVLGKIGKLEKFVIYH